MAIFETRDGIEYAILTGITSEDELGSLLYERAQKQKYKLRSSGIIVDHKRRTFEGLMCDLETKQMTKRTYEKLLKKMVGLT